MARTPLLSQVLQAFRTLHGAAAAGVPADEHAGRERERVARRRREALDRRGVLGGVARGAAGLGVARGAAGLGVARGAAGLGVARGAAGVAGVAGLRAAGALPLVRLGGGGNGARVVVVGAGLAGLHCAYRLLDVGIVAPVYDAASRVGGRVFTDRRTFPGGQHCELGGELIDTAHETMRDLSEELGIPLLDLAPDDAVLEAVNDFGGRRLSEREILDGFAPIARAVDRALATLTDQEDRFVYYDKPNGGGALDALSLAAWLDGIGASGPVRTLLEVAYTAALGLDPQDSNALNLLLLISSDLERFRVYGDSDERYRAEPGSDAFTTRLAAALEPGQLRLGSALEAIREAPDGGYRLTFARGATRFEVPADYVVLALPFTTLRRVDVGVPLPPAKRRAIAELGYGTNSKLMAGTATRVWRAQGANGDTFSDRAYQSSWDSSRLQAGATGIMTNFTGGATGLRAGDGTPGEQAGRFLELLDGVFPGVRGAANGRAVRMHWPTYPLTLGSYSAYRVGQYTAFAGAEIEPVDGLFFCGEHTSLDFQGYMEGAALTGALAAEGIGDELGVGLGRGAALTVPVARSGAAGARVRRRARATRTTRRWGAVLARSLA